MKKVCRKRRCYSMFDLVFLSFDNCMHIFIQINKKLHLTFNIYFMISEPSYFSV